MAALKKALGFSAIEAIGSRGFDFLNLVILLNTLSPEDLAEFGVASSLLFIFNLVLITPETSLLRDQKKHKRDGSLPRHLSSFYQFSALKITSLYLLAAAALFLRDSYPWALPSILLAISAQQIQFSEISRIFRRMELKQKQVARIEIVSKGSLTIACCALLWWPHLQLYLLIYLVWSLSISVVWLAIIRKDTAPPLVPIREAANRIRNAVLGFSLWQHISGALTYYLYNIDPLFLKIYGTSVSEIATYTAALKVSNLCFVVPMFLQSFVPVALANAKANEKDAFFKLLKLNLAIAIAQIACIAIAGPWIAQAFGATTENLPLFYTLMIIINIGVLLLNITRPISTYLLIKDSPKRLLFLIFIPTAVLATAAYPLGINSWGVVGCAVASAVGYAFFGLCLCILYLTHLRNQRSKET